MRAVRFWISVLLVVSALGCKKKEEAAASGEGKGGWGTSGEQEKGAESKVEPAAEPAKVVTDEGDKAPEPVAEPAPEPEPTADVCTGESHSCVLKPQGDVVCMGNNLDGQLGDGTAVDRNVPVPVVGITDGRRIACGSHHTCVLRRNGEVSCWGRSYHGELGNGSVEPTHVPVPVAGLTGVVQVEAGWGFSCARLESGKVMCWGSGEDGRLGNGGTEWSPTPVEVKGIGDATRIALGNVHACALRAGGKVSCWGHNSNGQLGLGDDGPHSAKEPAEVVELEGARAIGAGVTFTCAAVETGVRCWGGNSRGQLGDGTKERSRKPVEVQGLGPVVDLDLGGESACALTASGEVRCWGYNNYTAKLLATGSEEEAVLPPAPVQGVTDAIELSHASGHSCAVRKTGAIVCWGSGEDGKLGYGDERPESFPFELATDAKALAPAASQPYVFEPSTGVEAAVTPHIAQGYDHVCGITAERKVFCFGEGGSGQLGGGSTQSLPSSAGRLVPGITDAVQVAAAMQRTCVLRAGGRVACWGDLGGVDTSLPMPVEGIEDAVEIAVGGSAYGIVACVRHADKTMSCWGNNNSGQLGNGDNDDSDTPVKVSGIEDAAQIAISLSTVCVRHESGKASCWGSNYKGEVGNGSTESARVPVELPRLNRVTDISGSGYNFCVVAGGNVSCWGANDEGQIGNGRADGENPARTPTAVRGVRNAVRVFVGDDAVCALQRDGKTLCWGDNAFRQLGIGAETEDEILRPTIVDVGGDEAVAGYGRYVAYQCGRVHCCGLHVDGHVSCAGRTPINGGSDFFGLESVSSPIPVAASGLQLPATE